MSFLHSFALFFMTLLLYLMCRWPFWTCPIPNLKCVHIANWIQTGLKPVWLNAHSIRIDLHWCELVAFTLQFYPSGIHTLINTYSHPHLQVSCDCHAWYPRLRWLLYTHCRNVYFVKCNDVLRRSICVGAATDNVLVFENEYFTWGYLCSFDNAATFCYTHSLAYRSIPNHSVQLTLNVSLAPDANECARHLCRPSASHR